MNYQSLKGMIESLIRSYKCPECGLGVNENNIDIIGAAGVTINIDIGCTNCGKHSMIKTEVLSIDLTNKQISPENIQKLKQSLLAKNGNFINSSNSIKDAEIINLNNDLKKRKFNVSDLFGDTK